MALFLLTCVCTAQTTIFKGQVLNNNRPVPNYTILVDGRSSVTDDAGVFSAPLLSSVSQVLLQASGTQYVIVYPVGGRALIPKDATLVTQIVVEPFQSNKYLNQYLVAVKQLKDSTGKTQAQLKSMKTNLDSITSALYKLHYTQQNLDEARSRRDAMDLLYPEIAATLQDYINQARNLAAAFQFTSSYAFENHNALEQLVQAVNNFNPAYNKLFTNYPLYSQKIQKYWGNAQAAEFNGIADTLVNLIAKQTIVPLNDLKTRINQYFLGQVASGSKDAEKKDIQAKIAASIPGLNTELNQAEKRIGQFEDQLKNNSGNGSTQ
jgi:hypothetical protein